MSKIRRKGSGRTVGSFSFVNLTLQQLNDKFADKTTPIRVSRKFAQEMGFKDLVSKPANALVGDVEGVTPTTQASVTVTDVTE
jgi:hypothetical protein